jgi:hypothetical protein
MPRQLLSRHVYKALNLEMAVGRVEWRDYAISGWHLLDHDILGMPESVPDFNSTPDTDTVRLTVRGELVEPLLFD